MFNAYYNGIPAHLSGRSALQPSSVHLSVRWSENKQKYSQKTSGGPLSALMCCVNVRLLSGDKKNIAVNLFSKLGWELGLYYASYDDFHPDILARMYT